MGVNAVKCRPGSTGTLTVLCVAVFLYFAAPGGAVTAVPNKAKITGTVLEYCLSSSGLKGMEPERDLYKVVVLVEEAESVEGLPNFLRDKKGKPIICYSKYTLSPEVFRKKITAIVEYRGDERGGAFWIEGVNILE